MGPKDRETTVVSVDQGAPKADDPPREGQLHLSTLLSNLPGVAYRCAMEPTWPVEFISEGVRDLTGYAPSDLMRGGTTEFVKLIHPGDRDRVWTEINQACEQGGRFEVNYRIVTADGTKKWVWERGQAVCDDDGSAVAIEGFITDVTDDHQSVDKLRKSEERFRLLSKATSDAVWDLDLTDDTLWWGEGFAELFGGTLSPTLDSWSARIHPDDAERVLESLNVAIDGDVLNWSEEYRFRRQDDTFAHVIDRGHILRDANGAAVRMVGGMTDVTERKRLEARLLQSQKMDSIGQFAGGLAHDFNNLLSVILCTADMGLASTDEDAMLHADLVDMREAAQRASDLTRQLLAFGRRQVLDPANIDLNTVVGDMLDMLRRLLDETITVEFEPRANLDQVHIDRGQLEQVLVNLVVNARDAMPSGGTLYISTEQVVLDDTSAEEFAVATPGKYVVLEVQDTGVGIDEATCKRIFDPYFTTKDSGEGTGLGLATVYGIVEQSGGSIGVNSKPGRGTTFKVCFPPSDERSDDDQPPANQSLACGDETILVVEDDSAVRRLTARVLRIAGYTVLLAENGEAALSVLERHPDSVDLVLSDVIMPHMGGPGLAERLSESYPDVKIVFMTGYAGEAVQLPGLDQDVRLIPKPLNAAKLTEILRDVLDATPAD